MENEKFEGTEDNGFLTDEEFMGNKNYIKNPDVGEEIVFVIENIKDDSKNHLGKAKDGTDYEKGFKDKNGPQKFDFYTSTGAIYTPKSSMVYYALKREIQKYREAHPENKPSWRGAKISIKHIYDGSHSSMKIPVLKAILSADPYNKPNLTDEDVAKYQAEVKAAKDEFRLYEVKLLN